MVKKFECKKCGKCCRNLRGRTKRKEPPSLPPDLFGNLSMSERTIMLFEWEVTDLQLVAEGLTVDFRVKPDFMIWDDLSNVPLVLSWNLDHDDCPFISKENRCLAQDRKPLVCQSYPLQVSGLVGETDRMSFLLSDCPNAMPLPFEMNKPLKIQTLYKEAFEVYAHTFDGILRFEGARRLVIERLSQLTKKWIIFPAVIDEEVKKSLLHEKPLGLIEHLRIKYPEAFKELAESVRSIYEIDTYSVLAMCQAKDKKDEQQAKGPR